MPAFVVSIMVSSHPQSEHGGPGCQGGAVPVLRVERLSASPRVDCPGCRAPNSHQRGASTAQMSPFFSLLTRLGLYQRFIDHQRSIHTFVSNLRGPGAALTLLGLPINGVVPLSVATGNVTAAFTAVSHVGSLVISINADPETCPDCERLQHELQRQLDLALGS